MGGMGGLGDGNAESPYADDRPGFEQAVGSSSGEGVLWRLFHSLFGFNYYGPNTPISDPDYVSKHKPVNFADRVAFDHDMRYLSIGQRFAAGKISHAKAMDLVRVADQRMVSDLLRGNRTVSDILDPFVIGGIVGIQGKMLLEDYGIFPRGSFSQIHAKDTERLVKYLSDQKENSRSGVGVSRMEPFEMDIDDQPVSLKRHYAGQGGRLYGPKRRKILYDVNGDGHADGYFVPFRRRWSRHTAYLRHRAFGNKRRRRPYTKWYQKNVTGSYSGSSVGKK